MVPKPSLTNCDHRIDKVPNTREGQPSPSSYIIASRSESVGSVESQADTTKLHNAPGFLSSSVSNTGEDPSRLSWMVGSFEWLDAPAIKDLDFSESFGLPDETHTDSSTSEMFVVGDASFAEVSSIISPMAHLETIDQYSDECGVLEGNSGLLNPGLAWPGFPLLHKPSCNIEERLLKHFMTNLSVHLYPINQARNPYTTVYAMLAKESRPMLDGILFSSAMHLTNLGHLNHSALKPYRSARQKSFRGAIQTGNNYWALGLTVLLSVAMDVIGTGMDLWSSKLAGCRKLLELGLAKSSGPIDAGQKCALMQFNWMAAMGTTLLMGVRPLSSLEALDCIHRDEIYSEPLDDSDMAFQQQHWWANMPDFRMHLLLREATDLAIEVQKAKDSGDVASILRTMPQVGDLVQRIQGWHPDLSTVAPEYADSVVHFNCLWRQGLLCFVYHDIYHLDSNDERVQGCVESSVSSLESLSWFQACQWPIFMLAVHAKTERSRNCFEVGFVVMHATLGFSAPKSLVLVLQRIWQAADAGASKGWRDVVEEMGIELNILL
ncbi:hypothetical protein FANTH_6888 [Fusarium anthophilum]|uniref:Transcription factor n=1 Tax=Fusarium anthophilum TaxID=48485 RepID=A0A8H4ZGI8_9HYPO|nr:hypothetical protein FANTH_6888 [Fusarium anthophilum]